MTFAGLELNRRDFPLLYSHPSLALPASPGSANVSRIRTAGFAGIILSANKPTTFAERQTIALTWDSNWTGPNTSYNGIDSPSMQLISDGLGGNVAYAVAGDELQLRFSTDQAAPSTQLGCSVYGIRTYEQLRLYRAGHELFRLSSFNLGATPASQFFYTIEPHHGRIRVHYWSDQAPTTFRLQSAIGDGTFYFGLDGVSATGRPVFQETWVPPRAMQLWITNGAAVPANFYVLIQAVPW